MIGSWLLFAGFIATAICQIHDVTQHCQRDCSHTHGNTVCGSDGQSYANICEFSVASCVAFEYYSTHLRITHYGQCSTTTTASPILSHCNDLCDEDIKHICGSDGVVYENPCKFRRAQCEAAQMNEKLFMIAVGDTCPQQREADCGKYLVDTSDLALEDPSTYVPRCPSTHHAVCASDGHTFSNECQMCSYMDTHNASLTIVADGQCLH